MCVTVDDWKSISPSQANKELPEVNQFNTEKGLVTTVGFFAGFGSRNMAPLVEFILPIFVLLAKSFYLTTASLPGMLFPRDTERREVKDLSGLWDFRADMSQDRNGGFEQMWFAKPLRQVNNM